MRADNSQRAAEQAARRGLERLRERSAKLRSRPRPAPALQEPSEQAPAPDLWDARFDALTDQLVEDLRRDLGPTRG